MVTPASASSPASPQPMLDAQGKAAQTAPRASRRALLRTIYMATAGMPVPVRAQADVIGRV